MLIRPSLQALMLSVALISVPVAAQYSATPAAAKPPATTLKTIDVKLGNGPEAVSGKAAIVQYTGWLYDASAPNQRGKKFDSSLDRPGQVPFGFVVGAGRVIKGWDQGVVGMKVGGKRTLIIPPELGYGAGGHGSVIPPNATLIFDIELLDVKG
jgi:FKBP-type peptidyl-prolyl cis-trans isomerase FkpA